MNPKVHIIVPVRNRCEITRTFITCLKKQTYQNYHLIIIDDASTDNTIKMVMKEIPMDNRTIIHGNGKLWWAGALQKAYDLINHNDVSHNDIVLITNDDIWFDPSFLETGISLLKDKIKTIYFAKNYSMQTGKPMDLEVHVDWMKLSFDPMPSEPINCVCGTGLFLNICDYLGIGGMHPILIPHYLSDYEYSIRACNMGMRILTHPSLKLMRNEETTGYDYKSTYPITSLKRMLSPKAPYNPIYWTTFILIACPYKYKLSSLYKVWVVRTFKGIKYILRGLK